jgi:YVTN family beta-propeller protein
VIDTDETSATYHTVVDTIAVGDGTTSVTLSPDGRRAYVGHQVGNKISVIDTGPNTVIGTITTDSSSVSGDRFVAINPDGSTLYVTDSNDDTVYVIPVATV